MKLRHPKHPCATTLAQLPTPDLVLDVGASDGRWSESVMHFWRDARYLLIDPIEYGGKLTHPTWMWHHVVAGDCRSSTLFDISPDLYSSGVYRGADATLKCMAPLHDVVPADAEHIFLKLDTHGFEPEILEGLQPFTSKVCGIQTELYARHLTPTAPNMLEMLNKLDELGFRLVCMFDVMNRYMTTELWQVDGIFFRKDHPIFNVNHYR